MGASFLSEHAAMSTVLTSSHDAVPGPWWREPWVLVTAGGIVMGLALGVRHVQGLFLLPVVTDHGWTRASFALAMAVQNLVWGVSQPLTGMIADRFGAARVVAACLVLYALGLAAMAHAATPGAFVWSAGVCVGVALSGTAFGAVYGAINRLVAPERRSWALGMAGAIGGFGQFVMVPSAQGLIARAGWSAALVALAIVMAMLLPLAWPLRQRPSAAPAIAEREQALLPALREAFGHRGFWLLNAGFLACGFQLAFIATHLPAYVVDKGLRPVDGVAALAIVALSNTVGTWFFGWLGATRRRKHLLAAIYLVRTSAMALFVLLPPSAPALFGFAAVMGFVWLGTVPLTNGLVSHVFGIRYINTLFGFVFLGHQLGSFLGVWLGGILFVATHSYDLMWLIAMALGVVSAALHWPIDDRPLARLALPAGARA
jgi:MFS family permease